jgi:hypothetical protein
LLPQQRYRTGEWEKECCAGGGGGGENGSREQRARGSLPVAMHLPHLPPPGVLVLILPTIRALPMNLATLPFARVRVLVTKHHGFVRGKVGGVCRTVRVPVVVNIMSVSTGVPIDRASPVNALFPSGTPCNSHLWCGIGDKGVVTLPHGESCSHHVLVLTRKCVEGHPSTLREEKVKHDPRGNCH